jgi:hypothetical protein
MPEKIQNHFKLLRSHWSDGDIIWIANAKRYRSKLLVNFCYFAPRIRQGIVATYPNSDKSQCIKIILPDEVLHMSGCRVVTNLELQIQSW